MKRIWTVSLITFAGMLAALLLSIPSSVVFAAGSSSAQQVAAQACGTINVAAAADLSYVMNDIAAKFQKKSGCIIRLSTGSSGNFLTQIENGAPFDVFFSADIQYPKELETKGFVAPGTTYLYAVGKIVLWVRNDSHLDVSKGMSILRDPLVRKIAIANPQHAPYGRAAEEALHKAGIYDDVKDRLVLGENISQAEQFVESGNAEVGIIAFSLVASSALKDKGRSWAVPETLYAPIQQGAVIVRDSKNPQGAREFLDYIESPDIVTLFERYGFALPGKRNP